MKNGWKKGRKAMVTLGCDVQSFDYVVKSKFSYFVLYMYRKMQGFAQALLQLQDVCLKPCTLSITR